MILSSNQSIPSIISINRESPRSHPDVKLEPRVLDMLGTHRKKAWTALAGAGGGGDGEGREGATAACSPEALDLLDRMLCYDHQVSRRKVI